MLSQQTYESVETLYVMTPPRKRIVILSMPITLDISPSYMQRLDSRQLSEI